MAIDWTDVVEIGSELSSVPVATQTVILAMVDRQIDDTVWGDMADDGRRYLAAHMGAVYNSAPGAAGAVVSESLGPMSRTYASGSSSDDDELATTKYGKFYLHMLRLLPTSLGFVP